MGAGKSTIGRLLAKELRLPFKDSDKEIELRTGANIPWIFDKEGEPGFRDREQAMIAELCSADGVVLATGGCAFHSRLLGSRNNTGDGYLMGVEAGAELSGMEFSAYYCIAPAGSTMTRSMVYTFGRYFDASGRELDIPQGPAFNYALARALLDDSPEVRKAGIAGAIATRALSPQLKDALLWIAGDAASDPEQRAAAVFALQWYRLDDAEYAIYRQAEAAGADAHPGTR